MMPRAPLEQYSLFDAGRSFPNGFVYRPDFLTQREEAALLGYLEDLPLIQGTYGAYTSKRRVLSFGWGYDFAKNKLVPGPPLPAWLRPFASKIAKWLDIPKSRVVEALVSEYPPGTGIGWHRDNEQFEHVIGVSLGGFARLHLRPLSALRVPKDTLEITLPPRSAYLMQKDSRWKWQHSIRPVKTLRYSITFRTLPAGVRLPRKT